MLRREKQAQLVKNIALKALLWIGAHGHTASCQRWLSLTAGASGLPHRKRRLC